MSDKLRIFETHGVVFSGTAGDQAYGLCPFTEKENKFYVNTKTFLWDSKTAGYSGSIPRFLELMQQQYEEQITPNLLKKLANNRGLPVEAFKDQGLGWNGTHYTFLVRDPKGIAQDIRLAKLGRKVISTAGANVGLWGAELLPQNPDDDVFVCEGEWDTLALRWLLAELDLPGVVVGLPGASIFKQEWKEWFAGRTVHLLYDADPAGEQGELQAVKRLGSTPRSITFTHWPSGVPSGFDVRDYVLHGAVQNEDPQGCWAALQRKFKSRPRIDNPSSAMELPSGNDVQRESAWRGKTIKFEQVEQVFKKWLFLKDTVGIEMMLATVLSQTIDGPPIWMFLVAPPGGAKTETVSSLMGLPQVHLTSTVTPHALISGANWKGDQDPSLIPKLNGKILVVKDFTAILSMRDTEKDEIFGILRDAYDGRSGKEFGNGVSRSYESRFTVLAAVTPRIYDLGQQHQSLGERFLKCSMGDNLEHVSERDIISRAIDNIDRDTEMKWELQDVVHSFLRSRMDPVRKRTLPSLTESVKKRIISLGMFGARMRGTVSRDSYRNEVMLGRPSAEVGSRLGIQLAKLAKSIAMVHGRGVVSEDDYNRVKKIVLDTISQRTEDIIRHLLMRCETPDDTLSSREVAGATRYPLATVQRILEDLHALNIVTRTGTTYKFQWTVSPYIRGLVTESGLYQTEEERNRPTRRWIRKGRKRA